MGEAGARMAALLELWNEWEIQVVVVVSFALQVFLFFFAGIRRYSVWSAPRILLWLAYLLADVAATYALGHMASASKSSSPNKHQLVSFWAPFLLLHLGGQDTITAYAPEDNKLWLRHLLNMFVQVAGTGYVFYKYIIIAGGSTSLFLAAMLVFAAGVVKYGQRIWALKCASTNREASGHQYWASWLLFLEVERYLGTDTPPVYPLIATAAHALHHINVKPFIIDRHEVSGDGCDSEFILTKLARVHGCDSDFIFTELARVQRADGSAIDEELVYKSVEVQLALLYDTQYTKAPVIHTRYGYCIRAFSLMASLAALVIFTASKRDGHTHSTPDIAITYLLLAGALALEIMSAFKAIGSTWTYAALMCCNWRLRRLARAILSARYHLVILKDGRWSNSVGQYNLISFCNRETKRRGIMAKWIGLQDWWNRVHYTRHVKLSPALKKFVLLLLRKRNNTNRNLATPRPGAWAHNCTGFDQLDWSFDCGFEESVLIWHMATGVFLSSVDDQMKLLHREAINILSDYMMYILLVHRDILPVKPRRCTLSDNICTRFNRVWWRGKGQPMPAHFVVQEYIRKSGSEQNLLRTNKSQTAATGEALVVCAWNLFKILRDVELDLDKKMEAIGSVWMEMLCYAATNASGDFHAKQLSNGGEFATHILLLTHILPSPKPSEVELSNKNEKPADNVELNVDNDGNDGISEIR